MVIKNVTKLVKKIMPFFFLENYNVTLAKRIRMIRWVITVGIVINFARTGCNFPGAKSKSVRAKIDGAV